MIKLLIPQFVHPNITFFDLKFQQLIMDHNHNALVLEIQMRIPKSHGDQYKVYNLVFIPIFSNDTISQLNTDVQVVGLSLVSNEMVAFNACYKKAHIRICNNQLNYYESGCLKKIFQLLL